MTSKLNEVMMELLKEKKFCMLLKISWYKFKLECYNYSSRMLNVIPMVTTKKIALEYKQKEMRKKCKHSTRK